VWGRLETCAEREAKEDVLTEAERSTCWREGWVGPGGIEEARLGSEDCCGLSNTGEETNGK